MVTKEGGVGALRKAGEGQAEVSSIELFFDLVYVLAITQLTRYLVDSLSVRGAGETLLLLLAVWGAWNYTSWFTNYFDPDTRAVRLALIGLMLASLMMSAWLPAAFGDRGLEFAAAYVALNIGRTVFALAALDPGDRLVGVFKRPLAWWSATGLLWLGGGLAHADARIALWLLAVIVEYGGVWFGFPVPGFGRSRTTDYTIAGGHMAERCQLFVILALGESILRTGANFGDLSSSAGTAAALVIAFVASVALWWIYFDRSAQAARGVISTAEDPGRLGVLAYTFSHVPIIAGIIAAAAAAQLTIAHPEMAPSTATTALILGGPALYLAGNALFKRALWGHLPPSRLIAVLALGALGGLATISSALVLLMAATAVLVGVAASEIRPERSNAGTP